MAHDSSVCTVLCEIMSVCLCHRSVHVWSTGIFWNPCRVFLSHLSHPCTFLTSLREWNFSLGKHWFMTAAPGEQRIMPIVPLFPRTSHGLLFLPEEHLYTNGSFMGLTNPFIKNLFYQFYTDDTETKPNNHDLD